MTYKGYRIEPVGTFAAYSIKAPGSGQVPTVLTGMFTTTREAMIAIDRSLFSLIKKGKRNAKKESSPTR